MVCRMSRMNCWYSASNAHCSLSPTRTTVRTLGWSMPNAIRRAGCPGAQSVSSTTGVSSTAARWTTSRSVTSVSGQRRAGDSYDAVRDDDVDFDSGDLDCVLERVDHSLPDRLDGRRAHECARERPDRAETPTIDDFRGRLGGDHE